MNTFHIGISYEEDIDKLILNDFIETISHKDLSLEIVPLPNSGPQMCIEWFFPTAIVAYISKPYFDSFLSEMGKDHYSLFKKGLLKLKENIFGEKSPKRIIVTSTNAPNKVKNTQYSLMFSIIADKKNGEKFKLLIPNEVSDDEYNNSINTFLDFLENYHSDNLAIELLEKVNNSVAIGKITIVAYNNKLKELEFLNPIPSRN